MTQETSGRLYIVATPIGNLDDISFRAVETLKQADVIAAEDTRHSKYLLQHYAISTPTVSLHEHNEQQRSEWLLQKLSEGESVALISDAGTPLVSDPGYRLVQLVRQHDIAVVPIPGCSALIAAISASGLSTERFSFEGFLPAKATHRMQVLASLEHESRTMIFYESPRRLLATLKAIQTCFGDARLVCLARELTKMHETILTLPVVDLVAKVEADENQQRGECVLLLEGQSELQDADEETIKHTLQTLLKELPVKKAAALTAELTGIAKNQAYQQALEIKQK